MPNHNPTLYLSKPILRLGGTIAPPELMKDILEIVVDESLHMPSMFILKVHNVYLGASEKSDAWRNEQYFNIGDPISIGFNASTTEDPEFRDSEQEQRLIEGEITGIEVKFAHTSEAHIIVRGYDISHRLHRGRFNRSFLNSTDTDIVRLIANENRIQLGQLEPSLIPHEYVFQENQTNMEFLRERAARIGFELFVQNNNLYFRKPKSETTLKLEWLTDISRFDVRVTSTDQVSAVEVNSWDYTQKKLISETVSHEQLVTTTGNGNGSQINQAFRLQPPPKMIVVDQPVDTASEAKQMAQSLYNELSGEFVTADANAEGNPEIRPGRVIALENMGTRYSGQYYVTGTCHRYAQGVYKTDFSVRGLREGSLISTLPPKTHLQPGQTLLVGIVTNNVDPKGMGRVKVKLPTLATQDESHWARVLGLGAANLRGHYCLPEINDEVLVGFEHGDIHRPYVIGGVWNGMDKTVETIDNTVQKGKVRLRTIKTRTGHTIQFVEEPLQRSKAGIYITTAAGHKVSMNDNDRFVEIRTAGRHNIKMDDTPMRKGINIQTSGRNKVMLNDRASTIMVKTRMGQSLTFRDPGMSVTLQTSGLVNVNAGGAVSVKAGTAANVTVGGAATVTAGGAVSINATGAISLNSVGAITATAGGPISLTSASAISLGAPAVTVTSIPLGPHPI